MLCFNHSFLVELRGKGAKVVLISQLSMAQTRTSLHFQLLSSLSKTSCKLSKFGNYNSVFYVRALCSCSSHHQANGTIELSNYKETFAKRMAMAGLKPHHRIALGVSGGPDSMALCVLAASWKTSSHGIGLIADKNSEPIDGLLAIVVDHGLRSESKAEANLVQRRVTDMGIKCDIAHCEWPEGRPKQGHLQEAARNKRYEILQGVCIQHHISVILIAHHADDQAELFILRLSRNSGVLGLAGMAFVSELFYKQPSSNLEPFGHRRSVLVRPLLEFSKEDMYKYHRYVKRPTKNGWRIQLIEANYLLVIEFECH